MNGALERLERRDATQCVCGHPNVSHGYGTADGSAWPDGSRIGRGPCGRRELDDSIFDMCPCDVFVEAVAS